MTPEWSAYITRAVEVSGLPARLLAALCAAEHGALLLTGWPDCGGGDGRPTNNPADISGLGEWPWYRHALGTCANGVTLYDTPEHGGEALGLLLRDPPPSLNLDAATLRDAAVSNPLLACSLLARSEYAATHYYATPTHPGGLLWACWLDPTYEPLWRDVTDPAPWRWVTVEPGDTLTGLALRYGTTVDAIMRANPIITDPNIIDVGWRLRVPLAPPPAVERAYLYRVEPGDTLDGICQRFRVPLNVVLAANPIIRDPNRIEAGWTLRIPR